MENSYRKVKWNYFRYERHRRIVIAGLITGLLLIGLWYCVCIVSYLL